MTRRQKARKNTLSELAQGSIYLNLPLLASPQNAALAHQGVSPLKFRVLGLRYRVLGIGFRVRLQVVVGSRNLPVGSFVRNGTPHRD